MSGFFEGEVGSGFLNGNLFEEDSTADHFTEAYSRALGGGLVDVTNGDAAVVDDGEFYEGEYSGPTNALEVTENGLVEVGNVTAGLGRDAVAGAVDITGDALGWKAKLALGLAGTAVAVQVFKPAIEAGTAGVNATQ